MLVSLLFFGCVPPDSRPPPPGPFDGIYDEAVMAGYSWVDENLAVMPRPRSENLPAIAADGVDLLVTLTEGTLDLAALEAAGLANLHLPIEDYQAPTELQMLDFVDAVDARIRQGQRVGVHCLAGRGRSGTMAAVWFVHQGMSPDEAIAHVRALRPGSIETDVQEQAVHTFAELSP